MLTAADPSTRFILPADAPLIANLAALWSADPALAAEIESISDPYPVEPTRDGKPTLALPTPDGKPLYLHSRFAPLDESRRLIDRAAIDQKSAFFIQGLGLGYHVADLIDRAGPDALVCVLEPDPQLLLTALTHTDFSASIESGHVVFFTKLLKSDLFTRLGHNAAVFGSGLELIAHPPSLRIAPDFHTQMRLWIGDFASYCNTSLTTLVLNGRVTFENVARNLPWYTATPGLQRLRDCYANQPAIIVSAGPSLRKNKHLLKQAAGNAVIIAVQTTLRPLLDDGIVPDFVTSLDYHDICTRFFENLPPDLRTELVAEPKASTNIFDLYPGPITLLGNGDAELLLDDAARRKPTLRSGATVAHLAYYLAVHMAADPIIFVGQDLGFSDGLCYAPGTSYEQVWQPELSRFCTLEMKQWEQIVREKHILRRAIDYQGNPTYTEERLFTYLQHFERDFASAKEKIIDATEGGLLKRGAQPMPLAEALEKYCRQPLQGRPAPHPGLDWSRPAEALEPLRRRREQGTEIHDISRQTLALLEEIRDHLDDQPRVNRAIARLDPLRARINQLGPCYYLVTQFVQSSQLQRVRADQRISADRATGADRQRRQTQRDIDHVRAILDAADSFVALLDNLIDRVAQYSDRQLREAA